MWVWICHWYFAHSLNFGGLGLFVVPEFKDTVSPLMTLCTTTLTFVASWHCVDLSGSPSQVVIWHHHDEASVIFLICPCVCVCMCVINWKQLSQLSLLFYCHIVAPWNKQNNGLCEIPIMWVSDPNIVIFFYIYNCLHSAWTQVKIKVKNCKVPDSSVSTTFHFYLKTSVCALLMST